MEARSALVVAVTPRQPSVFAGEELECVITFTNTNTPRSVDEGRANPAKAYAQRRVVSHAFSSTSQAKVDEVAGRLGKVGFATDAAHGTTLGRGVPPRRHRKFASRSEQWPDRKSRLPASHPHARQKSVVEHQVEDLSRAFQLQEKEEEYEEEAPPPVPESPMPDTYGVGQTAGVDSALRDSLTSWSREQADVLPPARKLHPSPLFPDPYALPDGHEKLIWAFAQFGGTMELDRALVRPADFDQLRLRLSRGELAPSTPQTPATPGDTPRLVGGGELGYDTEVEAGSLEFETGYSDTDLKAEHTPSVAALTALLFRYARSPTPQSGASRAPHTPRHMRSGSTLSDMRARALFSRTLPTYSTPPTILGIDMVLAPGESRSFTFRLRIPPDLPPSFHGHVAHFDYYMTVGTNRIDGALPGTQQSRLLHVPIRVYNHVGPSGAAACFDLLNPIVSLQPEAEVAYADADDLSEREKTAAFVRQVLDGDAASATALRGDTMEHRCMDTVNDLARTAGKVSYDIAKDGHVAAVLTLARARYRLGDAVQALVRMNLPGARVRIVRLAASLESHEEIDASLALLPGQRTQKQTRQVYATHHESTLDTRQTSIVLTIPSGATPEFATSGVKLKWTLRVSLLTQTSALQSDQGSVGIAPVPHWAPESDAYAAFHTAFQRTPALAGVVQDDEKRVATKLEIVECSVPIGVLPNSSKSRTVPIELYA